MLRFKQITDTHGDCSHSLGDAGSQDRTPANSGDRRQRSRCNEHGTECRHCSGVLRSKEVECMARIE